MADYIDREMAVELLRGCYLPGSDVPPVKRGHWIGMISTVDGRPRVKCSVCGCMDVTEPNLYAPYCWHCGAKMDEEML